MAKAVKKTTKKTATKTVKRTRKKKAAPESTVEVAVQELEIQAAPSEADPGSRWRFARPVQVPAGSPTGCDVAWLSERPPLPKWRIEWADDLFDRAGSFGVWSWPSSC